MDYLEDLTGKITQLENATKLYMTGKLRAEDSEGNDLTWGFVYKNAVEIAQMRQVHAVLSSFQEKGLAP